MTRLFFLATIVLFSCGQSSQESKVEVRSEPAVQNRTESFPLIGNKIQGDFDGDGKKDDATAVRVKEGSGNPVEDGSSDEFEIQFSASNLKPIKAGCCEIRLINEGDLNNDKADDISIFQAPMNGCTFSLATYSFNKDVWRQIVPTYLIPTSCDFIKDEALQNRIFRENREIFFYDTDMNSEDGTLIRRKVILKP